jgi:hypothetical protein
VQGVRERGGADELELEMYGAEIDRVRRELAEYLRAGR